MNWFTSLPQWFQMLIIGMIALGIVYRLFRYGVKIKAGNVEIDADNNETPTVEQKPIESGEGK